MYQVIPDSYKPYQDILCTTCRGNKPVKGYVWSVNRNKAGWEFDCTEFVREHEGHNLLVMDMEYTALGLSKIVSRET